MAQAYILIKVEVGEMRDVLERMRDIENIREAHMFTGPYDIIAVAEADEIDEITYLLLHEIRALDGINTTVTCIRIEE